MALEYRIFDTDPVGLEVYSAEDLQVVESFDINTRFRPFEDKAELHIYTTEGNVLLRSIENYTNIRYLGGSETAGQEGASEITLDPISDIKQYGFSSGGVVLVYNFLDNLFSETQEGGKFYIEEISGDRTEIRLLTNQLENEEIEDYTQLIKDDLESTSFFDDFRLNVGNNDLLIGVNIETQTYRGYTSVLVKLYEPLPLIYKTKQILTIEKVVSNSVAYTVESFNVIEEEEGLFLKGPNFNVEVDNENALPTDYLNYNELFSYPTSNKYREINSLFNKKGIDLSIDYNKFSSFIHFSSARERLRNFQYKLNLIESYQENATSASLSRTAGSTSFLSGSEKYWKGKIDNILNNFDHYDRHLYYSSGSTSWPKQNNEIPYIQATGSATGSFYTKYFSSDYSSASVYDVSNNNYLANTIPDYLREDPDSVQYTTFINMLGQHFDNVWIYAKALSDKYDNDNRLDYGIPKELVQDTLKNFGVKIYNSFKSTEDLFNVFTGQLYQTGSDYTKVFVSASNDAISLKNYTNDIHKRIYHNLPYLLKTKGTERGLKALIASFGVPTNNTLSGSIGSINGLYVRTIGGVDRDVYPYLGPALETTSSLGNIRSDNTGSLTTGSTLSNYVSIEQRPSKYTDDFHSIEVGYSPTYPLNDYIKGQLTSNFNIDNLIGDPRAAHSSSYELLISESNRVITSGSHHYGEFVRILKFYDNVLFKMIKDFVPARSNIDTGIIIKPHLLERNKIKQVQGSFEEKQYTGSIDTAFISGSQAGAFTHRFNQEFKIPLTASYTESIVTPLGVAQYDYHLKERTRYDGEFSGSYIEIYDHSLNDDNIYKYNNPDTISYSGKKFCFVAPPSPSPSNSPSNTPSNSPSPSNTPSNTPTPSPSPSSGGPGTYENFKVQLCSDSQTSAYYYIDIVTACSPGGFEVTPIGYESFSVGDIVQVVIPDPGDDPNCSPSATCAEIIDFPVDQAPTGRFKTGAGGIVERYDNCPDCNDEL